MKKIARDIPGYTYGTAGVAGSPVTPEDLDRLKLTVVWSGEDDRFIHMAGEVLSDQTRALILHWRSGIIATFHILRSTRAHSKALRFRATSDGAISASSSGFSTPVCVLMIRNG